MFVTLDDLRHIDLTSAKKVELNGELSNAYVDFAKIAPEAREIILNITDPVYSERIKFGSNVEFFHVQYVRHDLMAPILVGDWDFSKKIPSAKRARFDNCAMDNVTHLEFGPNIKEISFIACCDFSRIGNFKTMLNGENICNLKHIDFAKIAPNATKFDMSLSDFSGITRLNFGQKAQEINLKCVTGLIDTDFAKTAPNAKKIDLQGTNLGESITGITANPATEIVLSHATAENGISIKIINGILQMRVQHRWR